MRTTEWDARSTWRWGVCPERVDRQRSVPTRPAVWDINSAGQTGGLTGGLPGPTLMDSNEAIIWERIFPGDLP